MVKGSQNDAITVFSLSIKRTGKAEQKVSDFLLKMSELEEEDGILLLSAFGTGRRFNLFCATKNPDKLRKFLRSEGVKARELNGLIETANLTDVLRRAHHDVLQGAEIRTFGVFAFPTKAAMYYVKNEPPPIPG
jgi:hypothetical protein